MFVPNAPRSCTLTLTLVLCLLFADALLFLLGRNLFIVLVQEEPEQSAMQLTCLP